MDLLSLALLAVLSGILLYRAVRNYKKNSQKNNGWK